MMLIHKVLSCCTRPLWKKISRWNKLHEFFPPCTQRYSTSRIQNLEDVASFIKSKQAMKIVVMTGAGVSTASGIPDFRTPGMGLYDNVKKYKLPYPEALFEIDYFNARPEPFYSWAKSHYEKGTYKPNQTHCFIRLLHEKQLLLRSYTQNIDGLERMAGIPDDKLIEAHGSFHKAKCTACQREYLAEDIEEDVLEGKVPTCKIVDCTGVIKPDIVFFGEQLPARFFTFVEDMPRADLLLIMGTSLEVQPFAGIASDVLPATPRVLFNKTVAYTFASSQRSNDVFVEGDLIDSIRNLAQLLGWSNELDTLVNSIVYEDTS